MLVHFPMTISFPFPCDTLLDNKTNRLKFVTMLLRSNITKLGYGNLYLGSVNKFHILFIR